MRKFIRVIAGAAVALLLLTFFVCAPHTSPIKLPSGRTVELIGIGPEVDVARPNRRILRINYRTARGGGDRSGVRVADDLAAAFTDGAIEDGYDEIIVQETAPILSRRSCLVRGFDVKYTRAGGSFSRASD